MAPRPGVTLQGLTQAEDSFRIGGRWLAQPLGDGRTCVWLIRIEATLSLRNQQVFVPREYPPGGCEAKAILAHENRHVAINRDVVAAFAPRFQQVLRQGIDRANPLLLSSRDAREAVISSHLLSLVEPQRQAMHAEMRRRNGALDTPEAYERERVASGCRNWISLKPAGR